MTEQIALKVHGLDCAEEVAILTREVGKRPGVIELDFDVLNARMSVEYDPVRTSPADIVAAVAAAGMKAVPWEDRGKPESA